MRQNSIFKMHRYVWGWMAIFVAFTVSFPVAMMRVSQTPKFVGQPLKSLNCKGQSLSRKTATPFATCLQSK
jgi:hypothetical protein